MEATLILKSTLPYDAKTFWNPGEPKENACTDINKLLGRNLPWNVLNATLHCFRANDADDTLEPTTNELALAGTLDKSILVWYNHLKKMQAEHTTSDTATDGFCVSLSDETVKKCLVAAFIAAVHVAVDHSTGAEPENVPLLRYKLDGKGQSMLCDLEWMLDPLNPIEAISCKDLKEVVRWYAAP